MNPPITFPPAAPVLKLARPPAEKWAATLAEERKRLQEDMDALRVREENLREYEARLRALQAEIEAGRQGPAPGAARPGSGVPFARTSSRAPFAEPEAALQAGWEKLHRARELLEAEQAHLRDDRIAMREHETALRQREEALAEREARLAEREARCRAEAPVVPAAPAPRPVEEKESSAVSRLTTAPFRMARAVLLGGK